MYAACPFNLLKTPADYYLFSRTKALLEGCRFQSAEEVKEATMPTLKITGKDLQG
jgi:hypothetical protein